VKPVTLGYSALVIPTRTRIGIRSISDFTVRTPGASLEKVAGKELSKRFLLEKGEEVAKHYQGLKMCDWLARFKDGSRGIAMEVFTGDKSISQLRKQLENGMFHLTSDGVRNVEPYVMVPTKKLAARVARELGEVRGHAIKIIIHE
jgi:hypothetical protein